MTQFSGPLRFFSDFIWRPRVSGTEFLLGIERIRRVLSTPLDFSPYIENDERSEFEFLKTLFLVFPNTEASEFELMRRLSLTLPALRDKFNAMRDLCVADGIWMENPGHILERPFRDDFTKGLDIIKRLEDEGAFSPTLYQYLKQSISLFVVIQLPNDVLKQNQFLAFFTSIRGQGNVIDQQQTLLRSISILETVGLNTPGNLEKFKSLSSIVRRNPELVKLPYYFKDHLPQALQHLKDSGLLNQHRFDALMGNSILIEKVSRCPGVSKSKFDEMETEQKRSRWWLEDEQLRKRIEITRLYREVTGAPCPNALELDVCSALFKILRYFGRANMLTADQVSLIYESFLDSRVEAFKSPLLSIIQNMFSAGQLTPPHLDVIYRHCGMTDESQSFEVIEKRSKDISNIIFKMKSRGLLNESFFNLLNIQNEESLSSLRKVITKLDCARATNKVMADSLTFLSNHPDCTERLCRQLYDLAEQNRGRSVTFTIEECHRVFCELEEEYAPPTLS